MPEAYSETEMFARLRRSESVSERVEIRNRIVAANLDIVRRVARRLHYLPLADDDRYQAGVIGLIRAVESHGEEYDQFGAWARLWIRRAMQREAHMRGFSSVRLPLRHGRSALCVSLDAPLSSSDSRPAADVLLHHCDRGHQDPAVAGALARLDEKERIAVEMHFGMGHPESTYREIGKALRCSHETARAIVSRAIDRLREVLDVCPR